MATLIFRYPEGETPIHRLNALENVAGSPYPQELLMLSIERVVVLNNSDAFVSRKVAR